MEIVERFEIPFYQFLNEDSVFANDTPERIKNSKSLETLYEHMVLARAMDAKAVALQRTGKLGTYPSTRGQEAVFVGIGDAMRAEDVFVPYYRDMATLILRNVPFSQILLYWGGDERGNAFPGNNFPYSVPVGSQPLYATGVAYAKKYQQEKSAVLVTCGDGATSEGDFYEAINVAGVWKLPIVFVVINNQWAISVPRAQQTAAVTLAQKAIAAGIRGEQVDGNDVTAVTERTREALTRAREQHEPTLIECVCYRHHDHTTADDASRYENQAVREKVWAYEPITRLRKYLEQVGDWNEAKEMALQDGCQLEIERAVKAYLETAPQAPESMLEYVYEVLPAAYFDQYETLVNMKEKGGSHHG